MIDNEFKDKKSHSGIITMMSVLLVCILYYSYTYINLSSFLHNMISTIAKQSVSAVEANLNMRIELAQTVATSKGMNDKNISVDDKFDIANSIMKHYNYSYMYLIDKNGKALSQKGKEYININENTIKRALSGESVITCEVKFEKNHNNLYTIVVAPIFSDDNEVVGAFSYSFLSSDFFGLLSQIEIGKDNIVAIFSKDGYFISQQSERLFKSNVVNVNELKRDKKYAPFYHLTNKAIEDLDGFSTYEFDGVKYYGVYKQIENTDFYLLISARKSAVFKSLNQISFMTLIGTILILLATLCLSVYSKKLRKNLRTEKQRAINVVNAANLLTARINTAGDIVDVNKNMVNAIDLPYETIITANIKRYIKPEFISVFDDRMKLLSQKIPISDFEMPLTNSKMEEIDALWNASLNEGNIIDFIGVNISSLKEYQNRIQKLAYYDTLTELKNRTSFEEYVTESIKKCNSLAVMIVDFDNFKFINDSFGHATGDLFLVEVASRLKSIKTPNAEFFRVGGDEMACVYLNAFDLGEVGDYANMIFNQIAQGFYVGEVQIDTTCSIGISLLGNDGKNFAELFKTSEIAMNHAKELGKARSVFYNSKMEEQMLQEILMQSELKEALENEEFVLYYQPKFSFKDKSLVGFEALIRWNSKTGGFIPPGSFIPLVEKSQFMIPLGKWILNTAFNFSKKINEYSDKKIRVAVNVSVTQIVSEDFVSSVTSAIAQTEVNPDFIELELTESVLMESIDINIRKLKELKAVDVQIALDDFGTGYSSLTYLKKLPIDVLKVDKSFVDTILDENKDKEILSAIISLAQQMHLEVVAEGVETEVQWEWLKNKGCDICQGYFTGKPMSQEDAEKLVKIN